MRIWPGGLCVSRSIGDADAGPEVVSVPHIKQVSLGEHKDDPQIRTALRSVRLPPVICLKSWSLSEGRGG